MAVCDEHERRREGEKKNRERESEGCGDFEEKTSNCWASYKTIIRLYSCIHIKDLQEGFLIKSPCKKN